MKKASLSMFGLAASALAIVALFSPRPAQAQMMYGSLFGQYQGYVSTSSAPLDADELRGQAVARKLQSSAVSCSSLSQGDLADLGDYYVRVMMGGSAGAMDQYVTQARGADFDTAMHVAMGERFSGCDANAAFPAGMYGFGPMMGGWGMMANWDNGGSWNNGYGMMGWNGYGYGGYSIGWTILCVILVIFAAIGLVASIKWLAASNKR